MFPLGMSDQRDKFVSVLGRVVSHVDQLEDEATFLRHLGRDHRKYEVIAEHYNAVGASLFATLQHFLRDEWDADLAADWAAAYQVIARIMVEAADTSSESTTASESPRVKSFDSLTPPGLCLAGLSLGWWLAQPNRSMPNGSSHGMKTR